MTENVTVPVGWDLVPLSVSETTAVQVVVSFAGIVPGEQVTTVEVDRLVTVTSKPSGSLLIAWRALPRSSRRCCGSLSPDLAGPAPGPLLNRGLPSPDGIWGKESLYWW